MWRWAASSGLGRLFRCHGRSAGLARCEGRTDTMEDEVAPVWQQWHAVTELGTCRTEAGLRGEPVAIGCGLVHEGARASRIVPRPKTATSSRSSRLSGENARRIISLRRRQPRQSAATGRRASDNNDLHPLAERPSRRRGPRHRCVADAAAAACRAVEAAPAAFLRDRRPATRSKFSPSHDCLRGAAGRATGINTCRGGRLVPGP